MRIGWTVPPSRFGEIAAEDHKKIMSALGMKIMANLVMATPVDTGRARANWWPRVGRPIVATTRSTDQNRGLRLASLRFDTQNMEKWPVLYIANNLSYISELNNGSSKQAPANFVENAVGAASSVLR